MTQAPQIEEELRGDPSSSTAICGNCVEETPGILGCPLHPTRHESRDLRRGHCMADFQCRTAAQCRREWNTELRERFAAFVNAQRLGNDGYSRLMVNDELLEAFLEHTRTPGEIPPTERRT